MSVQKTTLLIAGFLMAGLLIALPVQAGEFVEGEHYEPLDRDLSDEPEVIEFFWYGCGTCNMFTPIIEEWHAQLPEGVNFRRVPAVVNPQWATHGKAYYIAEALGIEDQMHEYIFDAMHNQGNRLADLDAVRDLFVEAGVDGEEFDNAAESFQVDSQMRRAENLARRYGIRGTPTVIINDRYRTGPREAGGLDRILEVADYLIEQHPESPAD